jgi:predicted acylesterase/phospholipase RssA/CRP-like cAMP-binding protein
MRAATFLRNVPVLSGLSEELLNRLGDEVRERRVAAGGWIVREGEAAESAYIVCSGRVEVVDERPPEALIRVLRRGDVLGELALLRQGARSASARARRDTDLLELSRASFETLIQEAPSFALALTRSLGSQLAASRTPVLSAIPPRTISVVGLDAGAPVGEVAERLAGDLTAYGSVARLSSGGLAALDRAERDCERVVLEGGTTPDDEWTRVCMRETDLVVAVTTGQPDHVWIRHGASLRGCELFVLGPSVRSEVISELRPREVQVIAQRSRRSASYQATARRLAERSPGIVLSGGGARALAHLGVLEELSSAGLRFDRVAGVSLGSLVAATAAMGLDVQEICEIFERSFVATNPTRDYTVPAFSLLRGIKARRLLTEVFEDRHIEELPLRFFCLSCDLVEREVVIHRTGPVVDAVYPSFAIPGVFPPVATDGGGLLVDGGVLDNLPVATMARAGEGPVIAVDVTGEIGPFQRARRPGIARIAGRVRRALTGREAEIPGLPETLVRTLMVGSVDTVTAARLHADLVITPQVDGVGLLEWGAIDRVREQGREAARQALAADPDLPRRLGA